MDEDLPPLTGSPLLDPWRLRLRKQLAAELPEEPELPRQRTLSEFLLWQELEREPERWFAEYATGRYRLDFYCPAAQLAIEIDGTSHAGRAAFIRDQRRDEHHLSRGITTKRYSADFVEKHRDIVMAEVRQLTRQAKHSAEEPTPIPIALLAGPGPTSLEVPPEVTRTRRRPSCPSAHAGAPRRRPALRGLARLLAHGSRLLVLLLLVVYALNVGGARGPMIDGYLAMAKAIGTHFTEQIVDAVQPTGAPVPGG